MGRRRGQEQRPQVKGFRPGKAPAALRKKQAKQQMGDMNAAQERMVDLFADRSPAESRKLISRWVTGSLIGGVVLSILAVLAWTWTWIAGAPLAILAMVVFFSHFRLRAQRAQLEEMAEAVAKVTRR
jgi:Flp pilus assembly protein TadB